jgi:hypothetical protein
MPQTTRRRAQLTKRPLFLTALVCFGSALSASALGATGPTMRRLEEAVLAHRRRSLRPNPAARRHPDFGPLKCSATRQR